ncbi:hypothetical protein [Micromonospora sp. NPDC047134]|uniref:hypothetical protein n=1 Tax=Micromonospora sp. NPDC047134 TaxID=3154340 RepID=UPI0033D10A76
MKRLVMRISLRLFLILAVCVVLVVSIGTVLAVRSLQNDEEKESIVTGTFAYITEESVVVMRRDRVLVEVPRMSEVTDPREYRMVWTHDGRYLAFFSDSRVRQEEPEDIKLIVVDAGTGAVRAVPCPHCDDFTPVREREILVEVNRGAEFAVEHRLIMAGGDASVSAEAAAQFDVRVPRGQYLVSGPEHIITSRYVDGAEELRLTSLDGSRHEYFGRFDSNSYMPAAVSVDPGTGEPLFAVAFRTNPGSCGAFPIVLFRADGTRADTDMSAAATNGIQKWEYGVTVHDLWTEPNGMFRAALAATDCRSDDTGEAAGVKESNSAVYRLDPQAVWVRESFTPVTTLRSLDERTVVVLVENDCSGDLEPEEGAILYCNTGTLALERDGERKVLRDDVVAISAPVRR